MMIQKEKGIYSFVEVDTGLGEKCEGIHHALEFAADCMNRVRPIDQVDK